MKESDFVKRFRCRFVPLRKWQAWQLNMAVTLQFLLKMQRKPYSIYIWLILRELRKITALQQVLAVHPHSLISTSRETLKEA